MTFPTVAATPAHLGWRLLALVYDLFPAFALCLAFGALLTGIAAGLGHPDLSDLPWAGPLVMAGLWSVLGAYAVLSWRRGGQTMGMRPWRLRVVDAKGEVPTTRALVLRYAVATAPAVLGLELAALLPWPWPQGPFWVAAAFAIAPWAWALVDHDRATLYERASHTRLVRVLSAS